ncbi:hypothetical protein GC197_09875 [bacterium]|nr:hypothetical protein [bacterium]
MNTLSIALNLETAITDRKQKAEQQASVLREERQKGAPEECLEILEDELNGYLEDWFNAVDRLAYCIRKGYLPGDEWKAEYLEYFENLLTQHEEFFNGQSCYRNIIILHHEWKEKNAS